jgi:hypothetical protein
MWKVKPKGAVTERNFPAVLHRWSQARLQKKVNKNMRHTEAITPDKLPATPDLYQSNDADTFKSVRHSCMAEDEPADEFWTEPRKEGPGRSNWLARMIARLGGR